MLDLDWNFSVQDDVFLIKNIKNNGQSISIDRVNILEVCGLVLNGIAKITNGIRLHKYAINHTAITEEEAFQESANFAANFFNCTEDDKVTVFVDYHGPHSTESRPLGEAPIESNFSIVLDGSLHEPLELRTSQVLDFVFVLMTMINSR